MFPDLLENMFCRHKFDSIPFNNSHLYTQCQYSDSQWLLMPLFLSDLTAQLTYLLHIRQRWARLGETPAGWSYEEEAARLNAVTLRLTQSAFSSTKDKNNENVREIVLYSKLLVTELHFYYSVTPLFHRNMPINYCNLKSPVHRGGLRQSRAPQLVFMWAPIMMKMTSRGGRGQRPPPLHLLDPTTSSLKISC